MTEPSQNIVDFNFYSIEEQQFLRILARVTTSVVNIYFKQHYAIQDMYKHADFKDGDITNLHVHNLTSVH